MLEKKENSKKLFKKLIHILTISINPTNINDES